MERFTGLLGLLVIVSAAFLFSNNRKAIQPRVIYWGLGLQIGSGDCDSHIHSATIRPYRRAGFR